MTPALLFLTGLALLGLFAWYFIEHHPLRKKAAGLMLTLVVSALCVLSGTPPLDVTDATGRVVEPGRLRLGLDLKGGTSFQIRLMRENSSTPITKEAQERAVEVIRGRVDRFGVSEPIISPVGTDRILVQIPGLDPEKIVTVRAQLERVARLEFRLLHPQNDQLIPALERGETIVPPGHRLEREEGERQGQKYNVPLVIKTRAEMTGERVASAHAFYDLQGWGVSLTFDSAGARQFGDLTAAHVGERLAIVLDGKVQSSPVLESAIYGGTARITGHFTEAQARELASVLENPLQTPVKIEEQFSVSASLGSDSIRNGVLAGVIGVLATFVAVAVYYRFCGLVANVALLVNALLLFGVMTQFEFVLTLPGIAGIVLTIGIAIDANVLIYERLREELEEGKPLRAALAGAYQKAFSPIFDAHVTQILTSVILVALSSGPVRGFAITLTAGIICSLFSALLVTRNLFAWGLDNFGLKKVSMAHVVRPGRRFRFLAHARVCLLASLAAIVLSAGAFAWRGKHNFGLEFRGGDLLELSSQLPVSAPEVRAVLASLQLAESTVQIETKSGRELVNIRSEFDTSGKIMQALNEKLGDRGLKMESSEKVGALVGQQLARNSVYALLAGMLGIFLYLAFRFETSFALGTLVALIHDVVVVVGVFALSGREISLVMVGAVLTVAGYSVNDTVVVFDRIRSNLRSGRPGSVREIMDLSINETLSRTLLTASLTLISVLALLIFGGPVLNAFALAMLVGIVVGTFSSIFIAPPVALWYARIRHGDLREEMRTAEVRSIGPGAAVVPVALKV